MATYIVSSQNMALCELPIELLTDRRDLRLRTYEVEFVNDFASFRSPHEAEVTAKALMSVLPEGARACSFGSSIFRRKPGEGDLYYMQVYHPDWEPLTAGSSFPAAKQRIVVEERTARLVDLR